MANILIRNADVITLNGAGDVLLGHDIAIAGEEIVALGPSPLALPAGFTPDHVIEAADHVVLPGFFNAHTHAPMTLMRGWADDVTIEQWFNERIWQVESALTAADVRWGAYLAAAEMIRCGVIGFADHYFFMDEVAQVVEEAGLRASLAWAIFGLGSEQENEEGLARSIEFVRAWQGGAGGRIRTVLGPHSPYLCPPDFLERVIDRAAELDVGLHIHVAETPEQTEASLAEHGVTPVALLESQGLFEHPTLAAHCIGLEPADVEILGRWGVSVAHCPGCHMKLAMGVSPVPDLIAAGANVALGTDGPGSNNDQDILEEAKLTSLLHKSHRRDALLLPGDTVLRMATQHGARALGFDRSGVIAPGRPADLIVFDFSRPHLRPRHNLVSNIVYAAKGPDVRHVIVAGRILMRDRELTTLDEDRILYEAERRAFSLVGRERRQIRAYK